MVDTTVVIATLNVGTMTGRGREVVDVMERKKIHVLCVQETKWKGQKAKELGNGYKLYYVGENNKRNGVGVVLSPEMKEGVVQVNRTSDRIIWVKIEVAETTMNVVCIYAPQVGCTDEEKDDFWEQLGDVMLKIPDAEVT
ncbi:craniofacial development protein 2-like [Penaeus chinensis]|uniref:craniofacial development protein 2-like n=1 Tax=Penaeus chinensis TaxID=139456 RepID=UPI001FB6095C|nr:craniofacial development protein 2-like [Penaeus chinensis]